MSDNRLSMLRTVLREQYGVVFMRGSTAYDSVAALESILAALVASL